MKVNEILTEGRDAMLYHVMGEEKAAAVFASDTMPARWTHEIPGRGKVQGNSFTRNQHFQQTPDAGAWGFVCRIAVNQTLLAQTHKIIPVHGELIHQFTTSNQYDVERLKMEPETDIRKYAQRRPEARDRGYKGPTESMDEEFVVGDIRNLHKYITGIDIWSDVSSTEDDGKFLIYLFAYAKKFNIPVNVSPAAKKSVDRLLARQAKANASKKK